MIKKIIIKTLDRPRFKKLKNKIDLFMFSKNSQAMLNELFNIPVIESGTTNVDGKETPFVTLKDGITLFGRHPSDLERQIYQRWKHRIATSIEEDTIRVALDVVLRYLYPHAMPHIVVPYPRAKRYSFHAQHKESIWDLPNLTDEQKKELAGRFAIKKGEIYMDVGAYIGFGVVRLSREIGLGGAIFAVEADPDSFWLLKQNVAANHLSNVVLIPKAVSDQSGTHMLFKTERQANSLIPNMIASQSGVEVEVTTIDEILHSHGIKSLDRLCVTINGAEVEAVKGMMNTMSSSPHLRMSIAGWYKRGNTRICDIISPILNGQGYKTAVGRDGGLFAWK